VCLGTSRLVEFRFELKSKGTKDDMRQKSKLLLLTALCVGIMYSLPAASLIFATHLLEVMVVIHLGLEVLRKS
jgi:hypothetical protein